MLKFFIAVLFFLALPVSAAMLTRQKVLMGTFVSISVQEEKKALIPMAFSLLQTIESSLSSFDSNSPIYKLNHNKSARLDKYSYEALKLSKNYYKQTDGYFDIAVGSITKDLYRFGKKERIVSQKSLQKASTNLDALLFNTKEAIIPDTLKIDLGGMGKGYGVDRVSTLFRNHGVKNAIVALSGDIRCLGTCKIAVYNPLNPKNPLATFYITQSGVSTSGNYNRYVGDVEHNHLINPKKKSSEQNFISVTLISKLPSATLDAFATAVSVMPPKQAHDFLSSYPLAYIILQTDKKLIVSKNIKSYVSKFKRLYFENF